VIFLAATALSLFFATKDYFGQVAVGMSITWTKSLWWKAMEWYAWGLFSPGIFWLCGRLEPTGGRARMVAGQLAAAFVFSALHVCVLTTGASIEARVLATGFTWTSLFGRVLASHFHEDVLTYGAIVSGWYALAYYRQFRERERRAAELEAHLAKARLQALKMQLHPHFLFNTLNGIAALNYEDPKAANRMLARLSELLRVTLEDSEAPESSLRAELEFIRRYLALEQIRFGDRLTVTWDIARDTLEAGVPKLLLQPLVENALRHGLAPYAARGELTLHAHRENDVLHLRVTDTGPGLVGAAGFAAGTGVGLKNTRARLRELYGPAQRLELKPGERGGLSAEVTLPFRAAAGPDARFEIEYEDSHAHR